MSVCSMCGKYHGSAVCPMQYPEPTTAVPISAPASGMGKMVPSGEQQILDKLDEIIKLLRSGL